MGGRKVWYDPDVNRLNYDEHGRLLGEFYDDDSILVVLDDGNFYISTFDANNHYESNIKIIEKWDPDKVWTAVLYDADNDNNLYLKRFRMEATKRPQKEDFTTRSGRPKFVSRVSRGLQCHCKPK